MTISLIRPRRTTRPGGAAALDQCADSALAPRRSSPRPDVDRLVDRLVRHPHLRRSANSLAASCRSAKETSTAPGTRSAGTQLARDAASSVTFGRRARCTSTRMHRHRRLRGATLPAARPRERPPKPPRRATRAAHHAREAAEADAQILQRNGNEEGPLRRVAAPASVTPADRPSTAATSSATRATATRANCRYLGGYQRVRHPRGARLARPASSTSDREPPAGPPAPTAASTCEPRPLAHPVIGRPQAGQRSAGGRVGASVAATHSPAASSQRSHRSVTSFHCAPGGPAAGSAARATSRHGHVLELHLVGVQEVPRQQGRHRVLVLGGDAVAGVADDDPRPVRPRPSAPSGRGPRPTGRRARAGRPSRPRARRRPRARADPRLRGRPSGR